MHVQTVSGVHQPALIGHLNISSSSVRICEGRETWDQVQLVDFEFSRHLPPGKGKSRVRFIAQKDMLRCT